jgi:ClpP class serine protease
MVGSIGVVAGMTKQVAPDQNGEISIEIVSSNAPNKRPDPTDSAGRAELQQLVDAIEALFIADVAASAASRSTKSKATSARAASWSARARSRPAWPTASARSTAS